MYLKQQPGWSKLSLAVAVAGALSLGGCKVTIKADEDEVSNIVDSVTDNVVCKDDEGNKVDCGSSDSGSAVVLSASGFEIPENAIFVAADAQNGDDITDAINLALFEVPAGSTVVLPKGTFKVSNSIIVYNANDITLMGYGMNDTVLDFDGSSGDDGFRFEGGSDLMVRDLGVYDTNKNGIKTVGSNGVYFSHVAAVWTVGRLSDETPKRLLADSPGAYGLYPVNSKNIVIEDTFSYGSRDAGIYVGQSEDVVVRNNLVEYNVAGIEIENTENADVYNNDVYDNTAGILAFDFAGLEKKYGGNIRFFNNNVIANNEPNVGDGAVSIAPGGTGFLVFSVSNVEIYENSIKSNRTDAVSVASYFMNESDLSWYAANAESIAAGWSPVTRNINIHNNSLSQNSSDPGGKLLEEAGVIAGYEAYYGAGSFPDILYGGIGELLANAGELAPLGIAPYAADGSDNVCETNNFDAQQGAADEASVGLVYGTNPMDPNNWVWDGTPGASNILGPQATLSRELLSANANMNCSLPRLAGSSVIFRGEEFGCNSDDLDEYACSL
jgi:parallel beta-helix repeat protein